MESIKISKDANVGNTFYGLVFSCFNSTDIEIPSYMQNPIDGMGTVLVNGEWFDWYDRVDHIEFVEAK